MTTNRIAPFCLTLLCLTLFPGCGSGRPEGELPELYPTVGVVTRSGQPVSGGLIRFRSDPAGTGGNNLIITSKVNADGTFELATTHALSQLKEKGAPAGSYAITYRPPGDSQGIEPIKLPGKVTIAAGPNDLTVKLDGRRTHR